jgi:hypothetical protein
MMVSLKEYHLICKYEEGKAQLKVEFRTLLENKFLFSGVNLGKLGIKSKLCEGKDIDGSKTKL